LRIAGAPDPFLFKEWTAGNPPGGNTRTTGKAIRDPRLVPGESTGVFIVAGQSNASNYTQGAAYVQANPGKIDVLSIYDGGTYAATEPLLGCETYGGDQMRGNIFTQFADQLISAGKYQRVILIPIGIGGTPVNLWTTPFGDRLMVAFKRAQAVGLNVTAVLWMQGEADSANSQAAYQADLLSVIAKPRAQGFNAPWFVGKCTYFLGVTTPAVRAAQAAVVNGIDIFAGADTDTLTAAYRYDNGHFNSTTGASAAATLWRNAVAAVL
jgi:hypothetical protein